MSTTSSFTGSAYSKRALESLFDATPATLEAAQRHYQASRVSKRTDKNDDDLKAEDVCECCKKRICGGAGASLFSLRALDALAELGLAFPLFFYLLLGICFMLLWVTLVASIGNLYFLYKQSRSSSDPNYFYDSTTEWPYYLHLVAMLGLFLMYIVMTHLMRGKAARLKKKILTEADYSVIIKNLGTDWHSADLKQHIESEMLVNGKSLQVVKINTAYVLTDYMQIEKAIQKIKQKKNTFAIMSKIPGSRLLHSSNFHTDQNIEEQIELEKVAVLTKANALEQRIPEKVGVAVVTFHTIEDAAAFHKQWSRGLLKNLFWCCCQNTNSPLYFAGRHIYVKTADQPRDIAWKNLHISRGKRIQAQLLTLLLIIGVVFLLYFVMFTLAVFDVDASTEKGVKAYVDKAPVSAVIFGVGLGIEKLAKLMARIEHHHSYSAHYVIIAYKLTIMQVFNSVFFPLFLVIVPPAYNFHENLMKQMHSLFYMNVFVKPMLRLCSVSHMMYFARKLWAIRQFKKNKSTLIQEAANETFQLPGIDMAIWYSDVLTKLMLALFYAPFIPAAAPLFCIGFVLDYWAAKFCLLRFASIPAQLNEMLAMTMMKFVKFSILLYGVGMMIFFFPQSSAAQSVGSIAFSLAFLYFFIPISWYRYFYNCCILRSKSAKIAGPFEVESANFPHQEVTHT